MNKDGATPAAQLTKRRAKNNQMIDAMVLDFISFVRASEANVICVLP